MLQQNTTVEPTANETPSADKMYPHCGIQEYHLEPGKALYAGVYDDTGVIRLSNVPATPQFAEDPDMPRGEVPFEAFVETAEGRNWLTHLLFEAVDETRWFGDVPRQCRPVAPINEQAEIQQYDTRDEHSTYFQRTDGEHVSFIVGKQPYKDIRFDVATRVDDESVYHQVVTLSYAEGRLLRDLLNRPEVAALLDQEV